jgi:hypothetical protein
VRYIERDGKKGKIVRFREMKRRRERFRDRGRTEIVGFRRIEREIDRRVRGMEREREGEREIGQLE